MVALGVWVLAFAGSLWHFNSVETFNQLGITTEVGYHGYVGYWSAFLTGVVALIVAGMVAERWYTVPCSSPPCGRSTKSLLGLKRHLVHRGPRRYVGRLDLARHHLLPRRWIYSLGNHERYGGWANLGEHEPSQARLFLRAHGAGMMVGLAFLIGLAIRVSGMPFPQ